MRPLLYLLLISTAFVLPSISNCQVASTSNTIKDIINDHYYTKSGNSYSYNNPIDNWPACSAPSELSFQQDSKGNLTLTWDGIEKQIQNYHFEIKFPEGVLKTDENIITVSSNKYRLKRSDIGARSNITVAVRRKCFFKNEIIYSNWVNQEISFSEPQFITGDSCSLSMDVSLIPNLNAGINVNDTLMFSNITYDTIVASITGVYWYQPAKSSDPPVKINYTTIKSIPYGNFYKFPIARYIQLEYAYKKLVYAGLVKNLVCPPVIVQPNACNVNAYLSYSKTTVSNENLITVKASGGNNGTLNGLIISNQDTISLVNGYGTITTCSDVTVNLTFQTIVNGVSTSQACTPIIIENECHCIEPLTNINSRHFNIVHPTCLKSTGDIFTNFPVHLTSIGGEFADSTSYTNLQPGVYYLRIKNIYTNCISEPYMFIINEQPPINENIEATVTQHIGCFGEKGIIEVTNPIEDYRYSIVWHFEQWSTIFTNLNAGFYQVRSKNPHGCVSISDTLWVLQGTTPPTPQITLTHPSCSPVVNTGKITVISPIGGEYLYAVNSGTFQTSTVFNGLPPGVYSVTVKSNDTGCTAVLSNIGINGVPNLPIPTVIITTQPSCTVSTGSLWVSAPIGPQYTSFSIGGAYQSSRGFSNLQPGTYNVTVKTLTGCISSPRVITINPNVPAASVTSQPTCGSILGTIAFTSPAGTGFTYSVNNGTTWQTGATFSSLAPGTYLCKYKNNSTNCISQALTLVVNPPPTFNAPEVHLTQPNCTDLFGSIQVVSPLGSEFTYSIQTIEPYFQANPVWSNIPSGIYSVQVRNSITYCLSQITMVGISPLLAVPSTPSLSVEDPTCLISTGRIFVDFPVGSEFVYSIDQINYSPVPVFTGLTPGNYSVVVKNIVSGCISTSGTATVNQAPEDEISPFITGANSLCYGDSIVLIASGGISYEWGQNLGSGPAKLIYPIVNTTYTVTVTDQNGCTASSSKMIDIIPLPEVTISGNLNPCINAATTLTASGGVSYQWSNGATNSSIIVSLSDTNQTSYTVTVTSSAGCVSTKSAIVTPTICNNTCQVTFSGPLDDAICSGESATISVAVTGCTGFSYLWSTGQTSNAIYVSPSETTYYYVTITGNDQSTIHSYILNVNPCFCQFSNIQLTPLVCNNDSYDLAYSFTITNPGNSGHVHIHDNYGNSAIHPVNGTGTYNGKLLSNIADGQQRTVFFEKSSYSCNAQANYIAPGPCNDPLPNSCTIQYTGGECNGDRYEITGVVKVANPDPGTIIRVTDYPSEYFDSIIVLANVYSYNFKITDLTADNTIHTVFAGGLTCADAVPSVQYNAPSTCDIPQCRLISVEQIATDCNPSNNTYQLHGLIEVDCEKDDIITVTILPENITVLIATTPEQTHFDFLIENLNSDGLQHSVIYYGQFTDTITSTYIAPEPCREMPEVNCGDTYSPPSITNNNPLNSAAPGDIFSVNGISFKVLTIEGSNGYFTGQGSMSIPFSSKKLLVRFNNINVNTFNEVVDGTVEGVSGQFNLQSTIPIDTLSIGGDICLVDPAPEGMDEDGHDSVTGLNDRGFGRDSLYYPDSTRYDPNGFDYNGIHRDTETPYNDFGCDMNGLDIDKNDCKVDSTLIIMRDSLLGQILPGLLDIGLENTFDKLLDSLSTFNCDSLRHMIDDKITALSYDRQYITGATNDYYKKGMHKNFASEPKPLLNNSNRSQNAIALEATHVELYRCDMLTAKLEELTEKLEGINQDLLKEYIKRELKKLNKTDLQALMENNDALMAWVLVQIDNYLDPSNHIGLLDQQQSNQIENRPEWNSTIKGQSVRDRSSAYFSTAYSGNDIEDFYFTPAPGEEETWLYNQGFKEIKGMSRAYYMEEAYRQIEQYNLIMGIEEDTPMHMPVLMSKDSAGVKYNIYLDNISLSPSSAKLDAYFVLNLPNSNNKKLVLQAENLIWGAGGMIGDNKLKLATAVEIRVSNAAMLRLNPATTSSEGCFVSWDCNGFKSIGLDADIELCRGFIIPLDPTTLVEIPEPARFSVNVNMELKHWSDFYFSLNANEAKAFFINGYSDYKFKVKGLTVDMSDYRSPHLINQPGPFMNEWRGFHLEELTVTFPNSFSSGSNPITAGVENFVIDDMGVSGKIFAANLLSIDNGSLGGWPFSIDTAMVIVEKNHLTGGGLVGSLKVPVFKNAMRYNASMLPGNKYNFSISPSVTEEMDMLLARVTLKSNSTVTVKYDNSAVIATAILNGSIQVGSQSDSSGVKLPSATFNNFKISNTAPYFEAGEWTISGGIGGNMAGFEIKVDKILPIQPNTNEAGLSFNIGVQFPCDLAAYGGLEIIGNMQLDAQGRQEWVYNRTKLNKLGIDAKFAAGHLKGYLETFEGNQLYGKGFQGLVGMDFTGIGTFEAMALFGKKDFKYFFIDAQATLSTGIPIGPIDISGFVGGVSYKMNVLSTENSGMSNPISLPPLGQSFSGNTYTPDSIYGLGLRAGVKMQMKGNPKIFNGSVVYEILFNAEKPDGTGGGVANMVLNGKGMLMAMVPIAGSLIEESKNKPTIEGASMTAHIRFKYDFNAKIFTGDLIAYLNASFLSGVGTGGKMVDAHIYVGPNKWYFHFGTPSNPCGIKVNSPFLNIELKAYLCIGTDIPGLPPIPSDVASLAGNIKPNTAFANSGNGFLFGASFDAQAKINAWIGSAEMKAKAGFDIMVRDFGDATCTGSNETLGINGWYGVGQIWALISGKLKILGVTIFDAGIAGILQAQLPNPFFAQATLGVKVKILFAKVNKKIKIKLGDECVIDYGDDGSSLGMKVINHITPGDDAKRMPTDVVPQVYFNLPLNTVLELTPDKFEVRKSSITLKSLKTGLIYTYTENLSLDNNIIDITPDNVFNAHDSIELIVVANVFKNGTLLESETKRIVFTTTTGYSTIPEANIESSYPINGMQNYYKKENNTYKGFLQLKSGMPEMFYNIPEGYEQKIRLTKEGGDPMVYDYVYKGLDARIEFPLDFNMLDNESNYTIDLIRCPIGQYYDSKPSLGVDISKQADGINLYNLMGNPNPGINENSNGENTNNTDLTILASVEFRVSKHNSFREKLLSFIHDSFKNNKVYVSTSESLDETELKFLVDYSMIENNQWLNEIKSKVYDFYVDLTELGYGVIALDNPSESFNLLSDQVWIINSSSKSIIGNNMYNTVVQDHEILKNLAKGTDYNPYEMTVQSYEVQQIINYQVPLPSPPLRMILKYSIPGLGVTSDFTFEF